MAFDTFSGAPLTFGQLAKAGLSPCSVDNIDASFFSQAKLEVAFAKGGHLKIAVKIEAPLYILPSSGPHV